MYLLGFFVLILSYYLYKFICLKYNERGIFAVITIFI